MVYIIFARVVLFNFVSGFLALLLKMYNVCLRHICYASVDVHLPTVIFSERTATVSARPRVLMIGLGIVTYALVGLLEFAYTECYWSSIDT